LCDGSQAGPTRAVENINARAVLRASGDAHVREILANSLRTRTTGICIGNDLPPRGGWPGDGCNPIGYEACEDLTIGADMPVRDNTVT
jgi:hypothetical protein